MEAGWRIASRRMDLEGEFIAFFLHLWGFCVFFLARDSQTWKLLFIR